LLIYSDYQNDAANTWEELIAKDDDVDEDNAEAAHCVSVPTSLFIPDTLGRSIVWLHVSSSGDSGGSSTPTTHFLRRQAQATVAIATATALIAFYRDHHRRRDEAQSEAVQALRRTFSDLTDDPKDIRLVATASAGLIPASVVLKGRAAVLDWVDRASRGAGAWRARLKGVLQILHLQPVPTVPRPPSPPTGLRTRWDWVQQYPQVLESFITNPKTGKYRKTRERYILARTPVGAALLLGVRGE
jgi:hypothetical protein